ncbi:AT-rich interactive domain-containing protein 4B-like [Physella acuta]|uniref:AT-rich interactive domain-containing protein 4B-like n=1 Tax=Physella acuta TaxID=109671 RepID=UPI0027DC8EC7|nr:AT-rich interactive domain-containing protein 4B-like [Physella acuta]
MDARILRPRNLQRISCVKQPDEASLRRSANSTVSDDDLILRKNLSSVVWVQCDNPDCLKWRKLRSEVANNITEETHWTCNMNDDKSFNSCTYPEESTTAFDKLAKRVKLDVIKSELKPGTLVWAKTKGYCRWPAIISADPANGLHFDGDGIEILWYHVEFVGGERTHAWVGAKSTEVFGPGNTHLIQEEKQPRLPKKKSKRQKRFGLPARVKEKDKDTYKGGYTVHESIKEALILLPLSLEDRLKTCWFTSENFNPADNSFKKNCFKETIKSKHQELRNEPIKNQNRKFQGIELNEENKKLKQHSKKPIKENNNHSARRELQCLDFPTSLLDVSKEERFILDLEMYTRNQRLFEHDVIRFMSRNGLKLALAPIWQKMEVSIFSLYLAVHERGGYSQVCERHLWHSVYMEVVQQPNKQGGSLAKRFYKRNLYPYELYVNGQDYSFIVQELASSSKQKCTEVVFKHTSCSEDRFSTGEEEFDSPDVLKHLDELDKILKSLENGEDADNEDRLVPVLETNQQLISGHDWSNYGSPLEMDVTGSDKGIAAEPEEKAQVVPELDFPSSVESSEASDDNQILHEMQALQYDMDVLQNEIDQL